MHFLKRFAHSILPACSPLAYISASQNRRFGNGAIYCCCYKRWFVRCEQKKEKEKGHLETGLGTKMEAREDFFDGLARAKYPFVFKKWR